MDDIAPPLPVHFQDVLQAAERIRSHAVVTPLLSNPWLDERVGGRILLKAETLQRTGSFKFRGAFNKLRSLSPQQLGRGVVAYSSGNHAQGVAAAAKILGAPATIVMPADAPAIKIANTRAYGAEVIFYDRRSRESREAVAEKIIAERGATLVPPYEDPFIIAGQGTCGLEVAKQAEAAGLVPDVMLVCCGGGGLTAGIATALSIFLPETKIYAVEPEGHDDTRRSLESGERQTNADAPDSICDAILTPTPGPTTFAINRRLLSGGLAVSEEAVLHAVAFAFHRLKLVVEPGGAVCLAAVLDGRLPVEGRTIALTLSGGNIDPAMMQRALERYPAP